MTLMGLHNIREYNFDADEFVNKKFKFDHLDGNQSKKAEMYLKEIGILFKTTFNIEPTKYTNRIFNYEIHKIPKKYDTNTLYSLDNAFYLDKIKLNNKEYDDYHTNIEKIKPIFINKYLPKCRLQPKNIVIHIRLGDAMKYNEWKNSINNYNKQLLVLIDILKKKYNDYKYYIHSDGDVSFLEKKLKNNSLDYVYFSKKTDILDVLSDLIHSSILICGVSSLSYVASFMGEKQVIITCDDKKHISPKRAYKISDYIKNNTV